MAIGPRRTCGTAGADTVRVVTPKYVEYVPGSLDDPQGRADDQRAPERARGRGHSRVATDTGNVSIIVRLPDRVRARAGERVRAPTIAFSQDDPLLIGQLVATALPPADPAAPPKRLLEAASLLVGLLLGIVSSLLLERGRPRLRTLARPRADERLSRVAESRLRARSSSGSKAFADLRTASAFRILRANLEPQLREGNVDLIVVTSPAPADGKTTVTRCSGRRLDGWG